MGTVHIDIYAAGGWWDTDSRVSVCRLRGRAGIFELLVDIDGEQIRTVLRNLLENAVKSSLPQSRPIEVSAAQSSDGVVVRVTDDGVGIPDGDVDRIFEPFFRVDRSRAQSMRGYGLGLSICKRVMEAHGGRIAVERTGRGTSFVLTFPRPAQAHTTTYEEVRR